MLSSLVLLIVSVLATNHKQTQSLKTGRNIRSSGPFGAHLQYFDGPVLSNVKVFTIFWGGAVNVKFASELESFYGSVTNSTWFDVLEQYSTPNQTIGPGSWIGSYSYDAGGTGVIDDFSIQVTLLGLIDVKAIPAPDSNTYYAIHFPPSVSITLGNSSSCTGGFCAYHGTITGPGSVPYIQYGVMPDQGGSCYGICGDDSSVFNNLCSISSHELAETITDPAIGLSPNNGYPLGWYDLNSNGEIGDLCNQQQGNTTCSNGKVFTVQRQFSNADNDCVLALGGASTSSSFRTTSTSSTASTTFSTFPSSTASTTPTASTTSTSSTTSTASTATTTGTNTFTSPTPTQSCAHPICEIGIALDSTCGRCAAQIIRRIGACHSDSWDAKCVGAVKTVCKQKC